MILLSSKSHLSSKLWKLNHSYSIFPVSLCGAQDHITISPGSCACDFFVSTLLSVTYYFLSVINSYTYSTLWGNERRQRFWFKKGMLWNGLSSNGPAVLLESMCCRIWGGWRNPSPKQPWVWSYNTEQWDLNFVLSNVLKLGAKLAECF